MRCCLGEAGELHLAGPGLARGYLRRPALTAERFVPDPFAPRPGERTYRTGDLVRQLPHGELLFLGRRDHQVKVRGFRIELGEVEAALVEHSAVVQAAAGVIAMPQSPEDRRLVAWVMAELGGEPDVKALRDFLGRRLPNHMVPASFVILPELPRLPNGKVDRKALPAPDWGAGDVVHTEPRGPVEELLASIWSDALGIEGPADRRIGGESDFFRLGGHSLAVARVVSRIREAFGVEIPVRQLFETPTLSGLAKAVEAAGMVPGTPPLVPRPREGAPPLSFAQERLWFLDRLEGASQAYNIPVAVRLSGTLDARALEAALDEIVRRHEALRSVFPLVDERPVQVVLPAPRWRLPVVDFAVLAGDVAAEVDRLESAEAAWHFDLAAGPLLRTVLVRLGECEHLVLLNVHHVVFDGWSVDVFMGELSALYEAFSQGRPSPLPELAVQYADFALWQRDWLAGEVLEEQLAFWRERLAGAPGVLELPADRPRPALQSYRGCDFQVRLPAALAERVKAFAQRRSATPYMVLLAGFGALLGRYAGQDEVVVGSPNAGRNRAEIEGLVGFFVNVLPLRLTLRERPSFLDLLGRAREVALSAYAHQDLPFEKLVEEFSVDRELSHAPIFQVVMQFLEAPRVKLELAELSLEMQQRTGETAKFDLLVNVVESPSGDLTGTWSYSYDLFDATTVRRMAHRFEALLSAGLDDPLRRADELVFLSRAERHQLSEWNDTREPFPDACLHAFVEAQIASTPDAAAVAFEDVVLSYADFDARLDGRASRLNGHGVGPGRFVGVFAERSIELVVTLHAVLRAGGAYVPLDPEYPRKRLEGMIEDAGLAVLLVQDDLVDLLPESGVSTLPLTFEELRPLRRSEADRPIRPPRPSEGEGWGEGGQRCRNLTVDLTEEPRGSGKGLEQREGIDSATGVPPHPSPLPQRARGQDRPVGLRPPERLGGAEPTDPAYMIFTSGSTGRPKGAVNSHRGIVNRLCGCSPLSA